MLFAYNPSVPSGGSRELKTRSPSAWLVRAGSFLDRAAFRPATLPDGLVTGIALLPGIVAGLVIFKMPAFRMLGVALAAGAPRVVVARWMGGNQRPHPGAKNPVAAFV